jgi:hypothetical protein
MPHLEKAKVLVDRVTSGLAQNGLSDDRLHEDIFSECFRQMEIVSRADHQYNRKLLKAGSEVLLSCFPAWRTRIFLEDQLQNGFKTLEMTKIAIHWTHDLLYDRRMDFWQFLLNVEQLCFNRICLLETLSVGHSLTFKPYF